MNAPSSTSGATYEHVGALAIYLLARSPFRRRRHWHHAAIIISDVEQRIVSRGDLSALFLANDLGSLAADAVTRRIPPGCVLVWLSVDGVYGAGSEFVVWDVDRGEVRR